VAPPAYRIPDEDQVVDAVVQVVAGGRIASQRQLADEVLEWLQRGGERYALSPERTRKIASRVKAVRIRVLTRRAPKAMDTCPFCDAPLEREDAKDLFGRKTAAGRACPRCSFRIDPGKRGPARYIFELRW